MASVSSVVKFLAVSGGTTVPRRLAITFAAAVLVLAAGGRQSFQASAVAGAHASSSESDFDSALEDCVSDAPPDGLQRTGEGGVADDRWPPGAIGGIIPPIRSVSDLFQT